MRLILIVDDDQALGRLYAESLAPEGWRVVLERDVAGALEAFRARPVDLVVIDAHLPSGTGFELAEQLRHEPRGEEVPLLFISGVFKASRHRADVIDSFRAVDFLEKPVPPGELAARIRIALGPELPTPMPPVEAPLLPTPVSSPLPPLGLPATGVLSKTDLAQRPFHELFAELARAKSTGLVMVRREKVKKIVALKDGQPVSVKSNLLADCLGRVMVRAGMITEAECAEALELVRSTGRRQGELLVELGHASARAVEEALELQVEQKLFDVFAWSTGEVQFAPKVADDQGATAVEMSAARALHEGLVGAFDEARLGAMLGDVDHLAVRLADGGREAISTLANAGELEPFASAMDGSRVLRELFDAKLVAPTQARALVVMLKLLNFCELVPPRPAPAPRRPTHPPRRLASPVDSADPDVVEHLAEQLEEFSQASCYDLLGVSRRATDAEIRTAWVEAAREFHPDKRHPQAPSEVRRLAEQLFDLFARAHATLADPEERARYDAENPESDAERAERILRADEAYRKGRADFDAGRYADAAARFHDAREIYPEEPEFLAYLALALFQADPAGEGAATRSLTMLGEARRMHPRLKEAPLFASHIQRARGDDAAAERELATARELGRTGAR